jgi:hypothetical protein
MMTNQTASLVPELKPEGFRADRYALDRFDHLPN